MSVSPRQVQEVENTRRGMRKECHRIDRAIWLWTAGKKLTKRQIQQYAKEAFSGAGISTFKASDGWYRRWLARWRKTSVDQKMIIPQKTDLPLERLIDTPPSDSVNSLEVLGDTSNSSDCVDSNESSECVTASGKPLTLNFQEDLAETSGLNDCITTKATKKKIERYLPQFKTKVVSYALKYSIKDAVYTFKVNKSTVADWIRDERRGVENFDGGKHDLVEHRPDLDFIEWLQYERKSGRLISKDSLLNKFKELATDKKDIAKKSLWFYKYIDRFDDRTPHSNTHIMYPTSFKRELAKMSGQSSKKTIGKVFNVDRKRINSWAERFAKDGCIVKTERDVNCYLTDDKVDAQIWDWFTHQSPKPNSKQIREQAVKLYRCAGHEQITCSAGWYFRWRKRYLLPSSSTEKNNFDEKLLCWILSELDDNKSVTHAELIDHATAVREGLKLSPSWVVRFLKRHSSLVQTSPSQALKLPTPLEAKVVQFKEQLDKTIECNSVKFDNLIAFDEIPLNFSSSGVQQSKSLLRKSGFENCHASVIVVCSARGILYPSTLIVKSIDERDKETDPSINVAVHPLAMADYDLLANWFSDFMRGFSEPSVYICDSFTPHKQLLDSFGNTLRDQNSDLMLIPEGCSSRLLPLLGIGDEFKKIVAVQWEKWLQETCWNINGVKLPPSKSIENWVAEAHRKCSEEFKEIIQDSFGKIYGKG